MDPEKIQAIRDYLIELFPDASHEDKEATYKGHLFKIVTHENDFLATLTHEFIGDNNTETIISHLTGIDLRRLLEDNPDSNVKISDSRVVFEPRN